MFRVRNSAPGLPTRDQTMSTYLQDLSQEFWGFTNPGGNSTETASGRSFSNTSPKQIKTAGLVSAGDGVIEFGAGGGCSSKYLMLQPFGAGTATNTFIITVLGWRPTISQSSAIPQNTRLWTNIVLGTYTVTLGTTAGIAGLDVSNTNLFATTITMTGGPTFVTSGAAPIVEGWCQISPGSNAPAAIIVRTFGFRYIECVYNTNSSATSANALYAKLS